MANLTTKLKKIYSQNVKNIEVFSQKALDELKDFEKKVDDLENRLKVSEEKLLDSEAVRNELKWECQTWNLLDGVEYKGD